MNAQTLVWWRKARQWTQVQAADWAGVTANHWARMERGVRTIPKWLDNRITDTPTEGR